VREPGNVLQREHVGARALNETKKVHEQSPAIVDFSPPGSVPRKGLARGTSCQDLDLGVSVHFCDSIGGKLRYVGLVERAAHVVLEGIAAVRIEINAGYHPQSCLLES